MGERALAHIEKVVTTYPIEGADKIEMTQVLDFHVVTKKGEFKTGDLVVYVEVDSILPDGLPAAEQARYDELKKLLKNATGEDIAKYEAEMAEVLAKNTRPEFEFLRGKKFKITVMKLAKFGIISQGVIFPLSILNSCGELINTSEGIFFRANNAINNATINGEKEERNI